MAYTETKILNTLAAAGLSSKKRRQLLRRLQSVSTSASVPLLVGSLENNDRRVRVSALFGLAHVANEDAVDAIIGVLERGQDGVTVGWAAYVLAKINARRAIPHLISRADTWQARLGSNGKAFVISALQTMPDSRAIETLKVAALDPFRPTRVAAAKALVNIDTKESRDALEWALARLSWWRRKPLERMLSLSRYGDTLTDAVSKY